MTDRLHSDQLAQLCADLTAAGYTDPQRMVARIMVDPTPAPARAGICLTKRQHRKIRRLRRWRGDLAAQRYILAVVGGAR